MKLTFDYKMEFGKERFCPENSDAKALCYLMKCKSLTKSQVLFCKECGWEVDVTCKPALEFMKPR